MTTVQTAEIPSYDYLIVDDEQFIRSLVGRIVGKMEPRSLRTADSGTTALDSIDAEGMPQIILCDLNMPEMDGVEFLRHLVGRGFQGGVIFISGEDKRILEMAVSLGAAQNLQVLGALSKPVRPQELQELVAKYAPPEATTRSRRPATEVSAEELRKALDERQLTAWYQPKVSVADKSLYGVETLVRWIDPVKGFIPPDAFIGVAEQHDMIDALTDQVLEIAMIQAGVWSEQGLTIKVAVNLSVDNLNRLDLPEFIVNTAIENGVNPHDLVLEVTESRLMQDIVKPLEILTRLRMKGLAISIDDFGTGHSSMEQLKRFPFTELKVDRAFVNGAEQDATALSILESSVTLAKRLDMVTVAEGVEDQTDWDLIARLGVDLVQGYFICKPLPGPELFDWATAWSKDQANG